MNDRKSKVLGFSQPNCYPILSVALMGDVFPTIGLRCNVITLGGGPGRRYASCKYIHNAYIPRSYIFSFWFWKME